MRRGAAGAAGAAWALLIGAAGCPEPRESDMVWIPWSGPAAEASGEDGFWIDRFEFPNQRGHEPTHTTDLETARQACARVGKRLCTAAEWRRACLGPDGRNRFGYGPRYVPRACHTEEGLPSGHTSLLDAEGVVSASGAWLSCRTPEGVYDLVGNVEEWVLDDWRGVGGMLEGGAWYTLKTYADCTGRYSREPDYRLVPDQPVFSAGFRCCRSEAAPTEADLSPEAVAADRVRRIEAARARASTAPYDPSAQVEVAPGLWMDRYEYPNRPGEMPLIGVSWTEARDRCAEAGKRLCTTREWERACGGPHRDDLPYGPDYVPGACAVGLDAAVPAGRYLACATADGVRDLVGSAWEWTATPLDAEALRVHPGESLRELRGGSWFSDPRKGVCRPVDGYPAAPEDMAFPDVGFRCCQGAPADERPLEPLRGRLDCPEGMVGIDGFCIDRYEHPNVEGTRPKGNLDWPEAVAACRGRGLRVCTEAEWQLACEGRDGRRWPYGDVYDPAACHLRAEPKLVGQVEAAPSGSFPGCRTPEGVHDLSGNLWEWVQAAPGEGPDDPGRGVLRGGGWNFSAGLGQCRARATAAEGFSMAQVGVRCCAGPAELARRKR